MNAIELYCKMERQRKGGTVDDPTVFVRLVRMQAEDKAKELLERDEPVPEVGEEEMSIAISYFNDAMGNAFPRDGLGLPMGELSRQYLKMTVKHLTDLRAAQIARLWSAEGRLA
jgi:hypothetical protein